MNSRTQSKDSSSSDASITDRQKNRNIKKFEKNCSMALKLLNIVARNCRRRLVMESFMKLRLQFQLRSRQRNHKPKSAQISNQPSSQQSNNQSWLLRDTQNLNVSQQSSQRSKLIHDIARKLESVEKHNPVKPQTSLNKSMDQKSVCMRLDRLQKMLKSIKKCHNMSSQASVVYSQKMSPSPVKTRKIQKNVNEFSLMDPPKNSPIQPKQTTYDRDEFKKDFQNLQKQLAQLKRVNEECIKKSEKNRDVYQPPQPIYPTNSPRDNQYVENVSYAQSYYPPQMAPISRDSRIQQPIFAATSFVIPTKTHIYTEIPTNSFVYQVPQPQIPQFREVVRVPLIQQSFFRQSAMAKPYSCQRLNAYSRPRYF